MALEPSTTSIFSRPRRARPARATDGLPLWLRRFRVEVLLWAFHQGRPVDAAALTAVLGAKHARDDEPFALWSREAVRELLWLDISRWCDQRGIDARASCAAALWTLLDHLDHLDGFAHGSDPLPLLREPLLDSGGIHGRGRRSVHSPVRHPSTRRAPPS